MKLSIVMPSHNTGTRVNSTILNTCTMGGNDIEVIIRDNSANLQKREFLSRISEKNCRILMVDECPGSENYQALVNEAKSDFVYFVCDDDYISPYALPTLVTEIDRIHDDPGVIGVTGIFGIEDQVSSNFFPFNEFDTPKASDRFKAFLDHSPSVFHYSPLRRSMMQDMWKFASQLPLFFSYHDWIINCIYLMHGRLTYVPRYIYQYNNANWADAAACLRTDAHYFRKAGLDSSAVRLQWLIGCLEGGQIFLHKYKGVNLPAAERQELAAMWIQQRYAWFLGNWQREAPDAKFDAEALKVVAKWVDRSDFKFPELLDDLCGYFSLSSPDIAQRYYDFWK
ncbi:MAG: glycosyltransferase [Negativicutes bacterium]|nr:glycosyltransferase [Negativicutes bacterium]